jgi:hypothetical protein
MGLIGQVRVELDEPSAVFWTDQQIVDALNEAQVCLAADCPKAYTTSQTISLGTSTNVVAFPSNIMIPLYITNAEGNQIFFSNRIDLENSSKSWKAISTGTPSNFVILDANSFLFYPRASTSYIYTIYGIGWPTEFTTSTDTTALPTDLSDALVFYACSVLFLPTRPDVAISYYKAYTDTIASYLIKYRKTFSVNTRRIRPASSLTPRQIGRIY